MKNKLITEINTLIQEELGISNYLDSFITDFLNKLQSEIKTTNKIEYCGILKNSGRQDIVLNNRKINVFWDAYFFNNEQEYLKFIKSHYLLNGYDYRTNCMNLSIIFVKNKIYNDSFYDTVYHEFEHAYQETLMQHEFGSQKLYTYAISNLRNKDINQRYLAWIIYASTKSEQDALINGLYGTIKNTYNEGDIQNVNKIIEDSEAMVWLNNLIEAYNYIKSNKSNELLTTISYYKKNFGFDKNKILRIARGSIPVLKKKISKVIFKTKKDFINEHKTLIYNPQNNGEINNFFNIEI